MQMLGEIVTVIVDRPKGSVHPRYMEMKYSINYGYIEGVIAPDGEEQDAYILGIDEPVERFTGKVIAVVHRIDDIEDKWIVAPENMSFSENDIEKAIWFQEKYFSHEIKM